MFKTTVAVGNTTILGLIVTVLGLAPIFSKAVQDGSHITVNGPEKWLAIAGIGAMAIVAAGRYLQAAKGISVKIKTRLTTVILVATGVAGLIPILEKSYSEGVQALHSPEKYAALAGVVAIAATLIGGYIQSLTAQPATLAR